MHATGVYRAVEQHVVVKFLRKFIERPTSESRHCTRRSGANHKRTHSTTSGKPNLSADSHHCSTERHSDQRANCYTRAYGGADRGTVPARGHTHRRAER